MPTRMRRLLFIIPALLALTLAAQAQKPALTKSVDEPGRSPYLDSQSTNCVGAFLLFCDISFKPVPAGYRLVVTHVSVYYSVNAANSRVAYLIENSGGTIEYLPAPGLVYAGPASINTYTVSTPITFYVEPTAQASIFVPNGTGTVQGSLTGYLVAIP